MSITFVGFRASRKAIAAALDNSNRCDARLIVAAAAFVGFLLRLRGAEGDLWLDEIWTLRLISRAVSLPDIFLHTPHANNHYLNSVWLWLLGPETSPLIMRSAAVVMGALSIMAAAATTFKQGRIASVLAAALFATSYFFVHYGSEARGYAGMILCTLVAKAALDRLIEGGVGAAVWFAYASAVCIGVFFHMTMVAPAGALACAGLARMIDEGRLRRGALIAVLTGLACLPGLVFFVANTLEPNFALGNIETFTFSAMAKGLGGAVRATLGLPDAFSAAACVCVGAAVALVALSVLPRSRRYFPIVAVFVLPSLHVVFGAPVQYYPRFHLITALGLLLLVSEALATLLTRGPKARIVACAALALYAGMQTMALGNFFRESRGRYAEAVRFMTEKGPATYSSDGWTNEIDLVINYTAHRERALLTRIPFENMCQNPPDWFIDNTMPDDPGGPPDQRVLGDCARRYVQVRKFSAWGLSGFNWWLYRRVD
jgi:hypothetical protein